MTKKEKQIQEIQEVFQKHKFYVGRMIYFSKTMYIKAFPRNYVLFNANIVVDKLGKVWWGDIDVTKESRKLKKVAKDLGMDLYILYEMDGRFEKENDKSSTLVNRAKAIIRKEGRSHLPKRYY